MTKKADVVVEEVTTEKKPAPSKATKGASLKKLMRVANEAVVLARKNNPTLEIVEQDAMVNLLAVRELVGTEQNGNLSVFGNMMHGMSGRLDQALMKHDVTEFAAILAEVAEGDNRARRSKSNEHFKLAKHAVDHLKRVGGNGIHSAQNFSRALSKVGMNHKTEDICDLMAPVLLVFQSYFAEMKK